MSDKKYLIRENGKVKTLNGSKQWLMAHLNKADYDLFMSEYGNKKLPASRDMSEELVFDVLYKAKVEGFIKNHNDRHTLSADIEEFKKSVMYDINIWDMVNHFYSNGVFID